MLRMIFPVLLALLFVASSNDAEAATGYWSTGGWCCSGSQGLAATAACDAEHHVDLTGYVACIDTKFRAIWPWPGCLSTMRVESSQAYPAYNDYYANIETRSAWNSPSCSLDVVYGYGTAVFTPPSTSPCSGT